MMYPDTIFIFLVKYLLSQEQGNQQGLFINVVSQSHCFNGVINGLGAVPRTEPSAELDLVLSPKPWLSLGPWRLPWTEGLF